MCVCCDLNFVQTQEVQREEGDVVHVAWPRKRMSFAEVAEIRSLHSRISDVFSVDRLASLLMSSHKFPLAVPFLL